MQIPDTLLKNKKILLGVTGSIAVYKSLELVRLFVKAGAEVRVVLTPSAKKFVTPLSFETLTGYKVLDDTNECWASDFNHIKITQWADIMVIAPATANTIAKLANAIADTMLLQCALAFSGVKIFAPSANTNMLQNPITQANLKMLGIANYTMVETQTKELACKTTGDGAMAEPLDIFYATARELLTEEFWQDRRVIVTGGGTREKIDEVRYISNFSSGKMANSLALALYFKGADVNLITTQLPEHLPQEMHTIEVEDTQEMLEFVVDSIRIAKKGKLSKATLMRDEHIHLIQKQPYLFMVAAVSDYVAKYTQATKLKKVQLGSEWSLELQENVDILQTINKDGITVVGFKAEMDKENALSYAQNMLEKKNLDAVCLNILEDASSFGTQTNEIEFITPSQVVHLPKSDKLSIAFSILENAQKLQG